MTAIKVLCDLESMRTQLHNVRKELKELTGDLLNYADDLDKAYKAIKKAKVAGSAVGIIGGVLTAVGFGLSFATFGATLGLMIAGGVIGGAGGVTSGTATIAEVVNARAARNKAKKKLDKYNASNKELLEKCKDLSEEFGLFKNTDIEFPSWGTFWGNILVGSGQVSVGFGWKMVASTIINALKAGKAIDVAGDISSAAVPFVRTLGQTAKGFHIAGGVVGVVFIPVDLYSLVSNSVELQNDTPHTDSKKIREIVKELKRKCPNANEIDKMVDESNDRILEMLMHIKKQLPGDLKSIREHLHYHFGEETEALTAVLFDYANELDQTYEDVPGVAAGVVEAKDVRNRAKEKLNEYNMSTFKLFEKCEIISENLKCFCKIDCAFSSWVRFWIRLFYGCRDLASDSEWGLVSETAMKVVRDGKSLADKGDVSSAAVYVEEALKEKDQRFNKTGILFLVDLYRIIFNSEELHYETAHDNAKGIRKIVKEIVGNCPIPEEIDSMIDASLVPF